MTYPTMEKIHGFKMEDRIMKKLLFVLAAMAAVMVSCKKEHISNPEETTEPTETIMDGYSKVYFDAGLDDANTKTSISGLSVAWSGTETVNIWYKDANGDVQKTAASFESFSGKTAKLSAVIPDTAPKDEFIAEVNGVIDGSGKAPFGTGSNRARYKPSATQTAVAGSFDPSAHAMGARWVYSSEDPIPHFAFKNLTNLLKISVDNQTSYTIDQITLSSSTVFMAANYWNIQDGGSIKIDGSGASGSEVSLSANITPGTSGDYYFVISTKNSSGMVNFADLKLKFKSGIYCREYSNSTPLAMTYNTLATLGSFTLTDAGWTVDESVYAPSGTQWTTSSVKAINSQISSGGAADFNNPIPMAAASPNTALAFVATNATTVNSSGNCIYGSFLFEFYTAATGTGTLTLSLRKQTAAGNMVYVYIDGVEQADKRISLTETATTEYNVTLSVTRGQKISLRYLKNDGSTNPTKNQTLYVYYSSAAHPITWTVTE